MLKTKNLVVILCVLCISAVNFFAQEVPPAPSAPRPVTVPAIREKKLPNGLTVAVVERNSVPLVTIELLIRNGADSEDESKAGLADLTAAMLTKGTKTKTATQIAEAVEFLGGSINSGAGWNSTYISVTVTSDKVSQAMAILSDVVLRPKFDKKELDLLKSQYLDGLTYNLKQPSFLANFVASKYSLGEHPAGGTPASLESLTAADVSDFYTGYFRPDQSVLIFTGDITAQKANAAANTYFGGWKNKGFQNIWTSAPSKNAPADPVVRRMLVIDLPKSGQASVTYAKPIFDMGRSKPEYFSASVLNSVLGGGYSSRLNYEIRIKRGLSYGAGSGFGWRGWKTNFATRTQTKNESAAEVAELVIAEITRLAKEKVNAVELVPRKSVLTGDFGRDLETTAGLAGEVGDLYAFALDRGELNSYVQSVNSVTGDSIENFAGKYLLGGDIIIVGDYSVFKDDLAKRFPEMKVQVVKADGLDLSKL